MSVAASLAFSGTLVIVFIVLFVVKLIREEVWWTLFNVLFIGINLYHFFAVLLER